MKFETIDELELYLKENDLNMASLSIVLDESETVQEDTQIEEQVSEEKIYIEILTPVFSNLALESGDENIIYVNDFESLENACGSGKVIIGESICFMNLCENENEVTCYLNYTVNGEKKENVPFKIQKSENPFISIKI